MVTKDMTQRLVQQMCRRMVCPQPAAAVMIDLHAKACANSDLTLGDIGAVHKHAGRRLERVGDGRAAAIPADHALVALLAA